MRTYLLFLIVSCALCYELYNYPNPVMIADLGCYCANVNLWAYEVIGIANTGAGCIGGCGGSPFQVHDYATIVSSLKVWTGGAHNGLKAMYIELFSGKSFTQGSIPSGAPAASISFQPGEYIVGDIEIDGNGIGTRAGYLKFTTSAGQKFQVGQEHTPYYFPSGNSFLTGFFGNSGADIDNIGVILMKPIKVAQLINVQYPTLSDYGQGLSPQIYKSINCNDDNSTTQQTSVTFTKTTGESYSWSIGVSFTFGSSTTVTAGLPEVAQVSEEFHWEVGITSSYQVTYDSEKSESLNFPVQIPPRTRVYGTFSWWDSVCNVPYTAKLLYTFTDSTSYSFNVSDSYTGAYITDVMSDFHSERLKPSETC